MKIPEPIIEPATIMVESSNPSSRMKPVVASWLRLGVAAMLSGIGSPPKNSPHPTGGRGGCHQEVTAQVDEGSSGRGGVIQFPWGGSAPRARRAPAPGA